MPDSEKTNDVDPRIGEVPPDLAALDGDPDESLLPTLGEVGRHLPTGYRDQQGVVYRDFEVVAWDWEIEEQLGELAEKNQEMSMGTYMSEVIGIGLSSLGDIDFSKLKRSQRRLIVSQLFHADAIYAYVHIRIAALGKLIKFSPFKCGCGRDVKFVGDLTSLEVKVNESDEVPTELVSIDRPFRYGSADVERVRVAPVKWAFMETADETTLTNPAKYRLAVLRYGVVGLEGVENNAPVVLTREHAREMGAKNVNTLVAAIDALGGGAVMECVGRDPVCKAEFRKAIDWTYDNFFGHSSP